MKNALMATTAAAALVFTAGAASAQVDTTSGNLSFGIGGFFTGGIGYVDDDSGGDHVGLIRDAEIHFDGRLTADNGLTFGVDIEFELGDRSARIEDTPTDSDGDGVFEYVDNDRIIDEASMFVSGSFGKLEVGEQDGAADAYMGIGIVAPPFTSAQDGGGFLFNYYDMVGLDANGRTTSDSLKISYFTPNFSGFSAGVSYIPQVLQEDGNAVSLDTQTNAVEVGAGWSGEFDGFSLGIGGGYTSDYTASGADDSSFGVGGNVGFGGFSLGVSYGWEETGTADDSTIGVGATYGTGPWVFGADLAWGIDGATAEDDLGIAAGMSYALAPGVSAGAVIEYAHEDVSDRDGFATGVFLNTNF
jgi:outer membrane protein OmpU